MTLQTSRTLAPNLSYGSLNTRIRDGDSIHKIIPCWASSETGRKPSPRFSGAPSNKRYQEQHELVSSSFMETSSPNATSRPGDLLAKDKGTTNRTEVSIFYALAGCRSRDKSVLQYLTKEQVWCFAFFSHSSVPFPSRESGCCSNC